MGTVVFKTNDRIRINLTCALKDTDTVIEEMVNHHITFDKKYTTIHNIDTPSTITFTSLKAEEFQKDLMEFVIRLDILCKENNMANIYFDFYVPEKKEKKDKEKTTEVYRKVYPPAEVKPTPQKHFGPKEKNK